MKKVKTISRLDVIKSSHISTVTYDTESKVLQVHFKNGGVYRYFDVPVSVYNDLSGVESVGKYHAARIKGRYNCEQVAGWSSNRWKS